jgi:hypothetical protein
MDPSTEADHFTIEEFLKNTSENLSAEDTPSRE